MIVKHFGCTTIHNKELYKCIHSLLCLSSRILAAHASSAEEKQRHLLDAFSLMKSAVSLQEQVLSDVLNVLPPHEVRDVLNITSVKMFFQIGCSNFGQKSAEFIPVYQREINDSSP